MYCNMQGNDGKWNKFGGRLPWDASVVTSDSHEYGGRGARSTGQVYAAAPNIDHTQERVRKDYTDWLRWLKNSIGFDGWRLDFVIGYAGKYTKEYIDATVCARCVIPELVIVCQNLKPLATGARFLP